MDFNYCLQTKTCTNFLQIYLVSVLSKFVRYLKRFFQNLFSNKDIFTSSSYVKYRTGLIIYAMEIFQNFYTYYRGSWKLQLGPYGTIWWTSKWKRLSSTTSTRFIYSLCIKILPGQLWAVLFSRSPLGGRTDPTEVFTCLLGITCIY